MPGHLPRSKFKKRRRKGFVGFQKQSQKIPDQKGEGQTNEPQNETSVSESVSKRKLEAHQETITTSKVSRLENIVDMPRNRLNTVPQDQHANSDDGAEGDNVNESITGYRLVDMECLGNAIRGAHKCKKGHLILQEDYAEKYGLMSSLYLECSCCQLRTFLPTSKNIAQQGKSYDINRRAVLSALELGLGFSGLETFSANLNLPCMSKPAYHKQRDVIVEKIKEEADKEIKEAGIRLRNLLKTENMEVTDESLEDIAVSFDGTWAKRGHTSLFGVVFAISVDTGEVLDYHVLSKYCHACAQWESKKKLSPEKYDEWRLEHLQSGDCTINFEGSSPAMEMEGAVVIWSRSIEKHNFRYTYMVSDGDSKSYTKVNEIKVYGDVPIHKLDCIGHVQKRMGKRLLNLKSLKKDKLADGKTIGGRGRLTEALIKKIQRYYGLAIRQNVLKISNPTLNQKEIAVYQMKKNIMAILSHIITIPTQSLQHRYCPVGVDSWCGWQRNEVAKKTAFKGTTSLPEVFLDHLKPIFVSLSDEELLKRCILGTTQNSNESINSLVWVRCPKHKFHGAKTVNYAAASAVLAFNGGCRRSVGLMEKLGTPVSDLGLKTFEKKDQTRIKKSEKARDEKEKKKRAVMHQLRVVREEAIRDAEGVTYESGAF